MANQEKMGSETIGAAGPKSKMTLFKDDRAEDIGSIIVTVHHCRRHRAADNEVNLHELRQYRRRGRWFRGIARGAGPCR